MADGGNPMVTSAMGEGVDHAPVTEPRRKPHAAVTADTATTSSSGHGLSQRSGPAGNDSNPSRKGGKPISTAEPSMNLSAKHLDPPTLSKYPSNSLPSTPSVPSRKLSDEYRTPPPPPRVPGTMSPRSTRSESESTVRPTARTPTVNGVPGCQYETGMAFSRRRMPYSIGGDPLEPVMGVKRKLEPADETKLTDDVRALYDRLLPSQDSEQRRGRLVQKLERILNEQWPGHKIKVHVFGSSGNLLCSNESDVDICITTPTRALDRVCVLAKTLADHGMQRVICVPNAKVPIVKIWDPELNLACDMNVNNTLALENTRMIRTYVQLDRRVRPLAMVVKYWSRRRILNDAALGGTLSSYTWICLIINFLQTRTPQILPSLQRKPPHLHSTDSEGRRSSFADNVPALEGCGSANKETIGELLFQFFRHYGHEFDYEHDVISIREGALLSKINKKWHLMQNNRLCVEEPFNTDRNLGNTADDISWRGVHLELRRAFDLVSAGKLDEACEEYDFPPQEEKFWVKPPQQPRPILTRSLSQQGRTTRTNTTGSGQRSNNNKRNGVSSRRASSAAAMNKLPPFPSAPPADRISGSQLHAQLFHHYQLLQAQEQQLRLQMHERAQQAQMSALANGQLSALPAPASAYPLQTGFDTLRPQAGVEPAPHSAPLRSLQPPYYPMHLQQQLRSPNVPPVLSSNQSSTNPPSPTMSVPHMASMAQRPTRFSNDESSAIRSHSQPPGNSNNRQPGRPPLNLPSLPTPTLPPSHSIGVTTLQQFQQLYLQAKLSAESAQRSAVHSPATESSVRHMMVEHAAEGTYPRYYYVDPNVPPSIRSSGFEVPPPPFRLGDELNHRPRRSSESPNISRQFPPSSTPPNGLTSPDSNLSVHMPPGSAMETARPSSSGSPLSPTSKSSSQASKPRSGPLIVDGSGDYQECAVNPEPQPFFVPHADSSHTSSNHYFTPPRQRRSALEEQSQSSRGRPRGGSGHLPNVLQFGDFPARATLRNHRVAGKEQEHQAGSTGIPSVTPLQAAFGDSVGSKESAGLGIHMSPTPRNEPTPTKSDVATPTKTAAATDAKLEGLDKSASFLSPVREVRTPSPTVTRTGQLSESSRMKAPNGAPISVGSPVRKGSILPEEVKADRSATATAVNLNARKPTITGEPENAGKTVARHTRSESSTKPNGSAFPSTVKESTPQAVKVQASPSAAANPTPGGWQQTLSKKAKRNSRKSASVGSVAVESERKGG